MTKAGELETLISIYSSMFSPGEHALEYEVGAPSCSCLDEVARLKGKDLYALSQNKPVLVQQLITRASQKALLKTNSGIIASQSNFSSL